MGTELIQFGKYKGKPLETLASDPDYTNWLIGQDWFLARFPQLHTVIINNFQVPDETPEHNRLQALFLDDDVCKAFVRIAEADVFASPDCIKIGIGSKRFEKDAIDVSFIATAYFREDALPRFYRERQVDTSGDYLFGSFKIEVKPSVGDDYPVVLRRMKTQNCKFLFIDRYAGSGVDYDRFAQIFANEGIRIVRHSDVNASSLPATR